MRYFSRKILELLLFCLEKYYRIDIVEVSFDSASWYSWITQIFLIYVHKLRLGSEYICAGKCE